MTTGLVGGHPVTSFTAPQDGKLVIQAADVRTPANALGVILTAHDAAVDTHFQSTLAATRVALTAAVAGAHSKWIDSDTRRIYFSNGSVFQEAAYLQLTDGGTVAGAVTLGSTLAFTTAATQIIPGATSLSFRNNANNADNLLISDAGLVTARLALMSTGAGTAAACALRLSFAGVGFYNVSSSEGRGAAGADDAFAWDNGSGANTTRLLVYGVNGAQLYRVKTGANSSGPGGTGRALYIDNE